MTRTTTVFDGEVDFRAGSYVADKSVRAIGIFLVDGVDFKDEIFILRDQHVATIFGDESHIVGRFVTGGKAEK